MVMWRVFGQNANIVSLQIIITKVYKIIEIVSSNDERQLLAFSQL